MFINSRMINTSEISACEHPSLFKTKPYTYYSPFGPTFLYRIVLVTRLLRTRHFNKPRLSLLFSCCSGLLHPASWKLWKFLKRPMNLSRDGTPPPSTYTWADLSDSPTTSGLEEGTRTTSKAVLEQDLGHGNAHAGALSHRGSGPIALRPPLRDGAHATGTLSI